MSMSRVSRVSRVTELCERLSLWVHCPGQSHWGVWACVMMGRAPGRCCPHNNLDYTGTRHSPAISRVRPLRPGPCVGPIPVSQSHTSRGARPRPRVPGLGFRSCRGVECRWSETGDGVRPGCGVSRPRPHI